MGVSAAWTISGEEFRDVTFALGSDDGSACSVSHACLRARGRRSGAIVLSLWPERSGTRGSRFVAGSFSALAPNAGSRHGSRDLGTKQFSRYVLDHGADADPSREQWLQSALRRFAGEWH